MTRRSWRQGWSPGSRGHHYLFVFRCCLPFLPVQARFWRRRAYGASRTERNKVRRDDDPRTVLVDGGEAGRGLDPPMNLAFPSMVQYAWCNGGVPFSITFVRLGTGVT